MCRKGCACRRGRWGACRRVSAETEEEEYDEEVGGDDEADGPAQLPTGERRREWYKAKGGGRMGTWYKAHGRDAQKGAMEGGEGGVFARARALECVVRVRARARGRTRARVRAAACTRARAYV